MSEAAEPEETAGLPVEPPFRRADPAGVFARFVRLVLVGVEVLVQRGESEVGCGEED